MHFTLPRAFVSPGLAVLPGLTGTPCSPGPWAESDDECRRPRDSTGHFRSRSTIGHIGPHGARTRMEDPLTAPWTATADRFKSFLPPPLASLPPHRSRQEAWDPSPRCGRRRHRASASYALYVEDLGKLTDVRAVNRHLLRRRGGQVGGHGRAPPASTRIVDCRTSATIRLVTMCTLTNHIRAQWTRVGPDYFAHHLPRPLRHVAPSSASASASWPRPAGARSWAESSSAT